MERESYLHDRLQFEVVYTRVGVRAGYLLYLLRTAMQCFFWGVWCFHVFWFGFCDFLLLLLFLLFSESFDVLTAHPTMIV